MQLTLRMPDNQMARIDHIAKKLGLKKSDVTRMAINKFIEDYSDDRVAKPFYKVKHLLGVVESGVPGLGQRHRNHLINKIKGTGN